MSEKPITQSQTNCEKSRGKTIAARTIEFKTEISYLVVDDFDLKEGKQGRSKMETRWDG